MPIGNDSYVENTTEVLKAFLVSSYKVYKRKNNVSGLGQKKEDFDKLPHDGFNQKGSKLHNASSKMFFNRKEFLLKNNLIVELPSNERGKFYGITPIGVSYYCKNVKTINQTIFDKILSHLKLYYENGKPKNEESYVDKLKFSLKELPDDDQYYYILLDIFEKISGQNEDKFISHSLSYELPTGGIEVFVTQVFWDKENGNYSLAFDINSKPNEAEMKIISQEQFNYFIAKFFIKAFLHTLYCDQYRLIPYFQEKLSSKSIKIRKKAKKDLNIANKILKTFNESNKAIVMEFNRELINAIKLHTDDLINTCFS